MGILIAAIVKRMAVGAGVSLLKAVDWPGVCARVLSALLRRAAAHRSYGTVRVVARRVLEQCRWVLAVTEDGVVTENELTGAVEQAGDLLEAWGEGAGKSVTGQIEARLTEALSEVKDAKG